MRIMLCPYCIERVIKNVDGEDGEDRVATETHVACTKTELPTPQRFNRVLVVVAHWECPYCNFTKSIYEKQHMRPAELIKSVSCFCCSDSGSIHHYLVRKFLIEDYISSDPPVPCQRCRAGSAIEGWDIATKEDCDRIHQSELSKIKFTSPTEIDTVKAVEKLAESKSMRPKTDE